MFDVCLLGCGGMMPLPNRWLTALLVRYNGRMILIDCGEGTQIPIKLAGWGFKTIDAICFTHYHADHIVGLPGLLLTMGNSGREEPLSIYGPPGLIEVIKGITIVAPQLPFEIKLIELSGDYAVSTKLGDVLIHSIPVDHAIPCLSYAMEIKRAGKFDAKRAKNAEIPIQYWSRLQNGEVIEADSRIYTPDMVLGEERKGLKVSYCTDTRPIESLIDFVRESDIFICEGMYGDDENSQKAMEKKHMTFSEAAMLAKRANVKEMWLTHYSPALDKPQDYLHYAKGIFDNTVLGFDLMNKTLVFNE
jgi:ribonuclease Z